MRKPTTMRLLMAALVFLPVLALTLTACEIQKTQEGELPDVDVDAEGGQLPKYDVDVEKTQEGKMPDVDVDAEGGQLPKYDVDPAEVEIGIEKKPVTVPDVDVDVDKKQIDIPVPDVNITPGNDADDTVEVAPKAE